MQLSGHAEHEAERAATEQIAPLPACLEHTSFARLIRRIQENEWKGRRERLRIL